MDRNEQPTMTVTATDVPDAYRLAFLPRHFKGAFMKVENAIFTFALILCPYCVRGHWRMVDLSNGGCYMAPTMNEVDVQSPNGHSCTVSGDAAGIVMTLFALSHLSFELQDEESIAEHFHLLRDFALDHPEAENILATIN